jgi:riboflavin kinase/FMN adenylyltransferase
MQKKYFGTVVKGLGNGKKFGFPTINIKLINNELEIDNGVYATLANIHNQAVKGMLYVGTRPTLDLSEKTIEIHLFDYDKNIYDEQISFQILHKIRDEIKFETSELLIQQLHRDREMVYVYFGFEI